VYTVSYNCYNGRKRAEISSGAHVDQPLRLVYENSDLWRPLKKLGFVAPPRPRAVGKVASGLSKSRGSDAPAGECCSCCAWRRAHSSHPPGCLSSQLGRPPEPSLRLAATARMPHAGGRLLEPMLRLAAAAPAAAEAAYRNFRAGGPRTGRATRRRARTGRAGPGAPTGTRWRRGRCR